MKRRLLVFAVHPDDEVIAAGGTLARYSLEGWETAVCFVTEAASDMNSEAIMKAKKAEAEAANAALGTTRLMWIGFPSRTLDMLPVSKLITAVSNVILEFGPEIVCIPFENDLNTDHRALSRAGLVATRPGRMEGLLQVWFMNECTSSTRFATSSNRFTPTLFVDVSGEAFRRKRLAFEQYASEGQGQGKPRSWKYLEACCGADGMLFGVAHAETFQPVWLLF